MNQFVGKSEEGGEERKRKEESLAVNNIVVRSHDSGHFFFSIAGYYVSVLKHPPLLSCSMLVPIASPIHVVGQLDAGLSIMDEEVARQMRLSVAERDLSVKTTLIRTTSSAATCTNFGFLLQANSQGTQALLEGLGQNKTWWRRLVTEQGHPCSKQASSWQGRYYPPLNGSWHHRC